MMSFASEVTTQAEEPMNAIEATEKDIEDGVATEEAHIVQDEKEVVDGNEFLNENGDDSNDNDVVEQDDDDSNVDEDDNDYESEEETSKGNGKKVKSMHIHAGKGNMSALKNNIAIKACKVINKRPMRKISAAMREKRFKASVKKLSVSEISKIIQYAPFKRMVVNALSDGVERVSTIAIHALMDAAVNYAHEIYNDSYTITRVSNKKQTLMLRHVAGAMYAKGTVTQTPNL